jgi:hypothetical protein
MSATHLQHVKMLPNLGRHACQCRHKKLPRRKNFCVRDYQQIVHTVVRTDTVVHTPRGGNTVDKLNKPKMSGHVCKHFVVGAAVGTLVVLLLLSLSLAVDDGEFNLGGGGGGGGGPAAAAVAAAMVAVVDNNWRQKRPATQALMVA